MIDLDVRTSRFGYRAELPIAQAQLGAWLEEVQDGEDYDIVALWQRIGEHLRGERPPYSFLSNEAYFAVDGRRVTVGIAVLRSFIDLDLDDVADATERWFETVAPAVGAALRQIRATWLPP